MSENDASDVARDFLRELEPGDDGLDPAGELAYGLEYRVEFPEGVARRYQAVVTTTHFSRAPLDGDKESARRFLESTIGPFLEEAAGLETPEELDRAMEQSNFTAIRKEPQLKYKLWQRIVDVPR